MYKFMARIILPVSVFIDKMKSGGLYGFVVSFLPLFVSCADVQAGNGLNPLEIDSTRLLDKEGISYLKQFPSRSPGGLLYRSPFQTGDENRFGEDWQYRGSIEFGYLGNDGDEKAAEFNNYRDWNDGALINGFDFSGWQQTQGYFIEGYGGGVGRDDQYYRLSAGRYGVFKTNAFYNRTPTLFSRNAMTIFDGIGSEYLKLPSALQPGANGNAQIQQALQSAYHPDLGIIRQQAGIGIEYRPIEGVKLYADFKYQQRDGARPFGGSFFPPFYAGGNAGGVVETIEPVDYSDNDITAGISYAGAGLQWHLKYNGSFFVNHNDRLTFENPFTNLPATNFIVERGRIALSPDNQFHQVQVDFAYALPLRGRLTSTVAWSRMMQDETLLPPTVNSGFNFTGIDLDQWNSTASLSRDTAAAEIDNLLLQVGAQFVPFERLTLRGNFRYQDEDNKTEYTALNPLTGQYGYISEDGAAAGAVFQPGLPQLPIHYRSIPFAKTLLQSQFGGDYRLTAKTRLGLEYQYLQKRYRQRERDKTSENRVKISLSSRSLSWATLRLTYQYGDRAGSRYDYNPYTAFYSSSLPNFRPVLPKGSTPHTLAELRKFDLSDRRQQSVSMQNHFLLGDRMDLSLSAKWQRNRYDARYGLQGDEMGTVNLEWNYQASTDLNAFTFYSFQQRNSHIANINDIGFSADPHAGGDSFPFSAAWSESADDNDHFAGLGLHFVWNRFDIDSRYSYNWSNSRIRYQATNSQPVSHGGFPPIRFRRHILETSLRWNLQNNLSVRFFHRFEHGRTEDWHYQDLQPLIGNQLFLNATPQNYAAHVFGVFLQYRL